jgi:hypothetical protein
MAVHGGANIVTDGLHSCWDAADKVCYVGSGTNIIDLTGLGHQGSMNNASVGTTEANVFTFDGNDGISLPDQAAEYTGFTAVSVAAWVYWGAQSSEDIIFGTGGSETGGTLLQTRGTSGIRAVHNDDTNYYLIDYTTGTPIPQNTWKYVVMTFYTSTLSLYIDAVYKANDTSGNSSSQNITTPYIGAAPWNASERNWIGKIASVSVYTKSLSSAEITQNFNAQRSRFGI